MSEIEIKLVRLCPNCGTTTNYDANKVCAVCGKDTKEEVISGDVTIVPPPVSPLSETPARAPRKMRMCQEYGKEIDVDTRFCPYHGALIATAPVNEGTIIALAAIGGVFGLHGLGHMIMGKIIPGFIGLFVGWILIAGIVLSVVQIADTMDPGYGILAGVLGVAYIILFVWQVIDANSSAKKTNYSYENHQVI
jgi:RNA polymerase subunit RPABC4/transcription elongation factor Spt4